ncbi:sterile alpha motif domain-containing 3-like isoform X2 [Labeo rohita]|uniref:Sterile alpha motif domain-containing 3-like isoform X2 n=1 Tax=Labeo rohita TaxID=84645 RepID=A0A498M2V4_LABRO|nr:sterile alpha motif domain-containing 3-like isoform X2 [Labeo rohita]
MSRPGVFLEKDEHGVCLTITNCSYDSWSCQAMSYTNGNEDKQNFTATCNYSDFRTALILLPHIFKEKAESLITLGECDADNPYPTIQLVETDWKMAFSKRVQVLVKADGVEVCRGIGVEEGTLAACSAYYVFNFAYPPYMKNTLTFLQHAIAKITEVGGKPLPITVTRVLNILCQKCHNHIDAQGVEEKSSP